MGEINKRYWLGLCFFYAAVILETLFVLLDKSSYTIQHTTWLFRFTFLLFGVKILLTKYSKREWLAIVLMAVLSVVSWRYTDREEIARVCALMIACKDVDIHKVMKVVFWETLTGSLVIMALALTGIYGTVTVTALFRGGGIEETRYCLGMGHPNALHCMFLVTMTLGLALYREQLKWYGYLIVFALNYGVYLLTDSRTSVLIGMAAITLAIFMRYAVIWRDKGWLYGFAIGFIAVSTVLSIYAAKLGVATQFLWDVNEKLNGRLEFARRDGGLDYWSLFSSEANQNYFDMGYVRLFYWYGIIPASIFLIALCITVWRCYQTGNYEAFLVIMVFAAYSIIEAHAVSVYIGRNYVLFYMGALLFVNGSDIRKGVEHG